jgi:cytochrome c oxidase cbb3-type subunit 1
MSSVAFHRQLLKFFVFSALSFFIGTMHGVLQVLPPIRVWLDSIGSPYGGPGHMIDPLAHAHMNLVGGVVLLAMGTTYYLLPILAGKAIYSLRLVNYTFWCVMFGAYAFYIVQLVFGIWEGLLLTSDPNAIPDVHRYYGAATAVASSVMGSGFIIYAVNVAMTVLRAPAVPEK